MSKNRGYERGGYGGSSNPLEDRHLKFSTEIIGATGRAVMVRDSELKKLRANNGKGTLKKLLYDKPVAIGDILSLQGEKETVEAKVTAIPEGLVAGKNKSTLIEVEIVTSSEK
jgi:hypothetical protein